MKIKTDIDLEDFKAWSGAKDTLEQLIRLGKCKEVEAYIADCFQDATETDINDFLWFEDEFIAELLGVTIDEFYEEV